MSRKKLQTRTSVANRYLDIYRKFNCNAFRCNVTTMHVTNIDTRIRAENECNFIHPRKHMSLFGKQKHT